MNIFIIRICAAAFSQLLRLLRLTICNRRSGFHQITSAVLQLQSHKYQISNVSLKGCKHKTIWLCATFAVYKVKTRQEWLAGSPLCSFGNIRRGRAFGRRKKSRERERERKKWKAGIETCSLYISEGRRRQCKMHLCLQLSQEES